MKKNERAYRITALNSTVNGSPGRHFDWALFCWDGSAIHVERCFIPEHPVREVRAPLPFKDGYLIAQHCQYLHVPYRWEEDQTIYRIRPSDQMWAGNTYHGHYVAQQTAELLDGVWHWVLHREMP